jgi:hypothetical protein
MRRKRRVLFGVIHKWKAKFNIDGGKQIQVIDYWDTYAAVPTWLPIRLILVIAIINHWELKQLNFVKAFPQSQVETELYMDLPKGYTVEGQQNTNLNCYGTSMARNRQAVLGMIFQ